MATLPCGLRLDEGHDESHKTHVFLMERSEKNHNRLEKVPGNVGDVLVTSIF